MSSSLSMQGSHVQPNTKQAISQITKRSYFHDLEIKRKVHKIFCRFRGTPSPSTMQCPHVHLNSTKKPRFICFLWLLFIGRYGFMNKLIFVTKCWKLLGPSQGTLTQVWYTNHIQYNMECRDATLLVARLRQNVDHEYDVIISNCIKKALHLQIVSIVYSILFYAYEWQSGLMILVKDKCMASLGCWLCRPQTTFNF